MATHLEKVLAALAVGIDDDDEGGMDQNTQAGEAAVKERRRGSLSLDQKGIPRALRGTPRHVVEGVDDLDEDENDRLDETPEERDERVASERRAAHVKRLADQKVMAQMARQFSSPHASLSVLLCINPNPNPNPNLE